MSQHTGRAGKKIQSGEQPPNRKKPENQNFQRGNSLQKFQGDNHHKNAFKGNYVLLIQYMSQHSVRDDKEQNKVGRKPIADKIKITSTKGGNPSRYFCDGNHHKFLHWKPGTICKSKSPTIREN